jgi:hypothetical protein
LAAVLAETMAVISAPCPTLRKFFFNREPRWSRRAANH